MGGGGYRLVACSLQSTAAGGGQTPAARAGPPCSNAASHTKIQSGRGLSQLYLQDVPPDHAGQGGAAVLAVPLARGLLHDLRVGHGAHRGVDSKGNGVCGAAPFTSTYPFLFSPCTLRLFSGLAA